MQSFEPENYFVLRSPLLSINQGYEVMHKIAQAENAAGFISIIKDLFSTQLLKEAIFNASQELYVQLVHWLASGIPDRKREHKLAISLYKYFIRMCTRCTPFGLFAGVATGRYAAYSGIELSDIGSHIFLSRLDMKCVAALVSFISGMPGIRDQLHFYPNNSIYRVHNKYRYVEYILTDGIRQYNIASVDHSPYLEKALQLAGKGCTLPELALHAADENFSSDEWLAFGAELVDAQILVSELEPTVTGEDYFPKLIKKLRLLRSAEKLVRDLEEIERVLNTEKHLISRYEQSASLIQEIDPAISSSGQLQVDTFLSANGITLKHESIRLLTKDINDLFVLSHVNAIPHLESFRNAFSSRYEEKEMPLLEVLDTELGIGYGYGYNKDKDDAPLINDINAVAKGTTRFDYNKLFGLQLKKLTQALQSRTSVVTIELKELEALKQDVISIPDSFFLIGNLLAASSEKIDQGDFKFNLNVITGPSSFKLLTRFCYGDPVLEEMVDESIAKEEAFEPEAVIAEVIHFPNARDAGVVKRVNTRNYEIPFLGMPAVAAAGQIPLSDLMVSVKNNRVLLRSKRLNKYVLPRLSTAHNYDKDGLPAYRFLGDMQYEGVSSNVFWNWGILDGQPFLPRVEYGRFILSRAKWNLFRKDHPALLDPKINISAYFMQLRQDLHLPRYLCMAKLDLELVVDLESETGLTVIKEEFARASVVVLHECLVEESNCFIKGPAGLHFNELIIPYTRTGTDAGKYSKTGFQETPAMVQREFVPHSEWLYVKLYTGTKTAEKILAERLGPFMQQLLNERLIDKWFYVRFRDPDNHLRVRMHHSQCKDHFVSLVLGRLNDLLADYLQARLLWKLQVDTYTRELERYGSHTMDMSEAIFFHDSAAIASFIEMLDGADAEKYRWLFSLRMIDMLLDDFSYSLTQKSALLDVLFNSFFREFGAGLFLSRQLSDKYRKNTADINLIMNVSAASAGDLEDAIRVFEARSGAIRMYVSDIMEKLRAHDDLSIDALLRSYIHMSMNRLFVSNQRKHELVVYHHLAKYYQSLIARRNADAGKPGRNHDRLAVIA